MKQFAAHRSNISFSFDQNLSLETFRFKINRSNCVVEKRVRTIIQHCSSNEKWEESITKILCFFNFEKFVFLRTIWIISSQIDFIIFSFHAKRNFFDFSSMKEKKKKNPVDKLELVQLTNEFDQFSAWNLFIRLKWFRSFNKMTYAFICPMTWRRFFFGNGLCQLICKMWSHIVHQWVFLLVFSLFFLFRSDHLWKEDVSVRRE